MPVIFQKWIERDDLKKNRSYLYLFGDNDLRIGFGGQAKAMRGETNAWGIRTKKAPSMDRSSFYTDKELYANIAKISEDFGEVFTYMLEHDAIIVIPEDGLGTGFSELPKRAPLTAMFLQSQIEALVSLANKM